MFAFLPRSLNIRSEDAEETFVDSKAFAAWLNWTVLIMKAFSDWLMWHNREETALRFPIASVRSWWAKSGALSMTGRKNGLCTKFKIHRNWIKTAAGGDNRVANGFFYFFWNSWYFRPFQSQMFSKYFRETPCGAKHLIKYISVSEHIN